MAELAAGAKTRSLAELRARIDVLDEQIVAALCERMQLAAATTRHKDGGVRDRGREAAVLSHVEASAATFGLEPAPILDVYRLILRLSRRLQSSPPPTTR